MHFPRYLMTTAEYRLCGEWNGVEHVLESPFELVSLEAEELPCGCKALLCAPSSDLTYTLQAVFQTDDSDLPDPSYRWNELPLGELVAAFRAYYFGEEATIKKLRGVEDYLFNLRDQFPAPRGATFGDAPREEILFHDFRLRVAINLQLKRQPLFPVKLEDVQTLRSLKCKDLAVLTAPSARYCTLRGDLLDLALLRAANSLRTLDLSANFARDFSPLAACTELVSLNLDATNVYDLSFLLPLKKLSTLFLRECPYLTKVGVLDSLPSLKHLMIDEKDAQRFRLHETLPLVRINQLQSAPQKGSPQPVERPDIASQKKAMDAMRQGQWGEAIALYEELVRNAGDAQLYKNLANCYRMTNNARQEEASLEKAFALAPSAENLKPIWDAYRRAKNDQKRETLGFICTKFHVDARTGEREWKDAAWLMSRHRSGSYAFKLPEDDQDARSATFMRFLDAVRSIGYESQAEKPASALSNDAPISLLDFLLRFFYDGFTRRWDTNAPMRVTYREEIAALLCSAARGNLYTQEEGYAGFDVDFSRDSFAMFQCAGREEILALEDLYYLGYARFLQYANIGYTGQGERDRFYKLLDELRGRAAVPFLDDRPLPVFFADDPWIAAAQDDDRGRFAVLVEEDWRRAEQMAPEEATTHRERLEYGASEAELLEVADFLSDYGLPYATIDCLDGLHPRAMPDEGRFLLAEAYAKLNLHRYALRLLHALERKFEEENAAVDYLLGCSYARQGQSRRALDYLTRADALRPGQHAILCARGKLLLEDENYAEALACFAIAAKLPDLQDAPRAKAMLFACCARALLDEEEATIEQDFLAALDLGIDDKNVEQELLYSYENRGLGYALQNWLQIAL